MLLRARLSLCPSLCVGRYPICLGEVMSFLYHLFLFCVCYTCVMFSASFFDMQADWVLQVMIIWGYNGSVSLFASGILLCMCCVTFRL